MRYLYTGLNVAQSVAMTVLLLAFAAVIIFMICRIAKYGWLTAAEMFDEYLEEKIERTIAKEEWQEINQIIANYKETGNWAQYDKS